jgi:energy-coupling factor transporter ATP-binding protein EcfA2
MSTELALIRSIIDGRIDGSMQEAVRLGISEDKFGDDMARTAWKYLFEHWRDKAHFHVVPSLDLFYQRFPRFELPTAHDPVGVIVEQFNREYIDREVRNAVSKLQGDLGTVGCDPLSLVDAFKSSLAPLHVGNVRATAKPLSLLVERHILEPYHDDSISLGLPFPWPFLNKFTPGIQPGNIYMYYGRPGSMKSWYLALTFAHLLNKKQTGIRALILSGDMPEEDFTEYLICCMAKIPVGLLRKKTLTNEQYEKMIEAWKTIMALEEQGGFIQVISVPGMTAGELSSIATNIEANIIGADAIYRMKDERTGRTSTEPVVQSNIVQSLKDIGLSLNVPIIGTTQANRSGEDAASAGQTMTEQAFTDAISQESAFLMRILSLEKIEGSTDRVLFFPKIRKSLADDTKPLGAQRVGGMPAIDFGHKGPWSSKNLDTKRLQQRRQQEAAEGEKKTFAPLDADSEYVDKVRL